MNVRITFFFELIQNASIYTSATLGWTETWFGTSSNIGTLDAWIAAPDVSTYIRLRKDTLPVIARIVWVRISDEANPRSFKVYAIPNGQGTIGVIPTTQGEQNALNANSPQVQCALLVDFVKQPITPQDRSHHRRFLMRCLPPNFILGNVLLSQSPQWPLVRKFLDFVGNHETNNVPNIQGGKAVNANPQSTIFAIRFQNPANLTWSAAPSVAVNVNDPRTFVVTAALPGQVGIDRYKFRRFPSSSRSFNGTWSLVFSNAGPPASTIFGRARRDLLNVTYTAPGSAQYLLVNNTYALPDQYTIIGLRTKKTGRNFRQPHGRVSAR